MTVIEVPTEGEIVVVDDDDADLFIVRRVLELSSLSNEIRCFSSGRGLMSYLEAHAGDNPPALVLTDVNMPGMDGFDVVAALCEHDGFSRRPIVAMLTSSDDDGDRQRALALGATAYLAKASGIREFAGLIDSVFRNAAP